MSDIQFSRLQELPLREAWKHEAQDFTPWLAENIDHLSEAIGIPLELTGTEVAVESFSADILARNPMDDSVILIENQLEQTDHTHLGQIMTYLAGLDAKTVVWIAPSFREPHLSAIRWLNEHTADGFSFFALKARVVRIGDSPFAPMFEVVEQPNLWDRQIEAAHSGDLRKLRNQYWDNFVVPQGVPEIYRHYNERYFFLDAGEEFALTFDLDARSAWVYLSYEGDEKRSTAKIKKRLSKAAPSLARHIPESFQKDEIILKEIKCGLRQAPADAAKFHQKTAQEFLAAFSAKADTE